MKNRTPISNSRQASQGDDFRFLAQSYIAHLMVVAQAICPCQMTRKEKGVGR